MILEDERDEVAALSDDVMDVPLYFEDVEVIHGLDGVHILVYHPDHVLEVVGIENALLEFRPCCLNDVCLKVGPKVVDGQVHTPSGGA